MTLAFARLRRLLASVSGISLDDDKLYLAESRLAPLMLKNGAVDLAELMRRIERNEDETLLQAVIDAMTTNETFFFRDRTPFELFQREMLPALMAARSGARRLRIWSAACSTGQEPYSLAIALEEQTSSRSWSIEILATDICETALETARRGVYSQFEAQRGLSTARMLGYFAQVDGGWQANERLRSRVAFRKLNLLSDFRDEGPFDVIFCRNVLIYFEPQVKRDVLARLSGVLADDGYLVLGAAETVGDADRHFEPVSKDCLWRPRRRRLARFVRPATAEPAEARAP
jgi:chemotaxis protein methyltransferase CheR